METRSTLTSFLKGYEKATKAECDAFSLRYGATLKRNFHAVDPAVDKVLTEHNLKQIWAADEMAEKLLTAPSDRQVEAVLKMIQGEYSEETPIYTEDRSRYSPLVASSYALSFGQPTYRIVDYKVNHYFKCGLRLSRFVDDDQ